MSSVPGTFDKNQDTSQPQLHSLFTCQVAATVSADGEAFKPQQMFLAVKHLSTGVSAYMVGKAKKGSSYEFTANAALIKKQIGKQVRGGCGFT
jgi:hypothetical protein